MGWWYRADVLWPSYGDRERWAERGEREGGSGAVGTFHSPVLLGDFPLTLLLSCQGKKCQWKKRSMSSVLLHVPAGDGALLCSVHIIVLSYMIVAYYIIIWYINYQALIALIFFCITAMWWHFFLKFSKYCLYLNISLSLLALYIDVEVFLQYALGQWVKRWLIANISLVFACISVFKGRAVVLDNCCPLGVVGLSVSKQLSQLVVYGSVWQ